MSSSDPLQALDFYARNNVIFITGGTGFVGKVILEKILWSLPQVQKIYVLVRASSKAAALDRLEREVFGCRLFETLKTQFSNNKRSFDEIKRKVVPIPGDIMFDNLGISPEDLENVCKDTHVFLNCAASINFDDPLRVALELNTHGPLRTLGVAKQMARLQAYVQVSTSYVNAHLKNVHIEERIYPLPFGDPEAFFCKLNEMSDQEISAFERDVILKMYPSTYKFTKSLAEYLMTNRRESLGLPLVIVRMPVVGGALLEPVPGWCQGISGAAAVMISCATGAVQEWYGDETKVLDMVPVDVVAKTTLMAGPALVSKRPELKIPPNTVPQPQFSQRLTDDIRADFYSILDFPRRYQQRFAVEIELAKASEEGAKKYGKILRKAEFVPKTFLPFTCYEWFFDAKNGLWLDDVAPMELHSGLRSGIDWRKYLHNFNVGVHDYILGEAVDQTKEIHYELRTLHKDFVAAKDEASELPLRSRI